MAIHGETGRRAAEWPGREVAERKRGEGVLPTRKRTPARKPVVPWVPTAESVVEGMLDLAGVGPGDVVYDLGCGDGRIVIGAAKRGATGVGFDIDRLRVREGEWNAQRAGVTERVRFVRGSLYDVDLRPASVVTLFLLPSVNRKLRPKLLRELATGSRIVSNYFDMDDWTPDGRSEAWGRMLYLWVVPAWVEGVWKCVMDGPEGRRHVVLKLKRTYQRVSGTVVVGRREVAVEEGRIIGARLSLVFVDEMSGGRRVRLEASAGRCWVRGRWSPVGERVHNGWAMGGWRQGGRGAPSW